MITGTDQHGDQVHFLGDWPLENTVTREPHDALLYSWREPVQTSTHGEKSDLKTPEKSAISQRYYNYHWSQAFDRVAQSRTDIVDSHVSAEILSELNYGGAVRRGRQPPSTINIHQNHYFITQSVLVL